MIAYREAPVVPGLPFPRKGLSAYTAITIIAAAAVLLLPLPFFASHTGWNIFRDGGYGMFVLLFLAAVGAVAVGVLGAFAVRGRRAPTVIIAGLPALPAVAGALFVVAAVGRAVGAISGASVDPDQGMRILAEGTSESDALFILACFVGASAFGAAAIGLLGGAASFDHAQAGARPGSAWVAPLAIGTFGILVALGLRFALRAFSPPTLVTIPSLAIVTALAALAARNAPLARGWHDAGEANGWAASLLAAALAAAAGVVLLDVTALFLSERLVLGAIAGESIDPSQKARILAEIIPDARAAKICAGVDGLFAFVTVAVALVGGLGRGPDGRARSPFGAPFMVALASVSAVFIALLTVRAWTFQKIESVAGKKTASANEHPADLPPVSDMSRFDRGDGSGATLSVSANGAVKNEGYFSSYSSTIVVSADRHAKWGVVAGALRARIAEAHSEDTGSSRSLTMTMPTLSIAVAATEKPELSQLGDYAAFASSGPPMIRASLEVPAEGRKAHLIPTKADEDMDALVAQIAAVTPSGGPIVLLAPEGMKWR